MLSLKKNILHALKSYFDNEKKVNLQFFDFSRRAHLAIESNGCVFAMQKLSVTWQITWNFPLYPFSSHRCTKRHYRSSDTLYNCNDYFATHSGWLGYSRKKLNGSL